MSGAAAAAVYLILGQDALEREAERSLEAKEGPSASGRRYRSDRLPNLDFGPFSLLNFYRDDLPGAAYGHQIRAEDLRDGFAQDLRPPLGCRDHHQEVGETVLTHLGGYNADVSLVQKLTREEMSAAERDYQQANGFPPDPEGLISQVESADSALGELLPSSLLPCNRSEVGGQCLFEAEGNCPNLDPLVAAAAGLEKAGRALREVYVPLPAAAE